MSDTSADEPSAVWHTVDDLVRWLDRESALPVEQERLLRILKLSEEAGEVAQAVIGATGQNPRKGRTHSWDDVHSELCDVIVTAMVALRTLTPEARRVFEGHLERVAERVPAAPGGEVPARAVREVPAPAVGEVPAPPGGELPAPPA
ncbi:MazG-like family protein [Streptomyces lydicus]|uniref:MazG-like family protein n=1 Tax=Streptomyces lydicus TaxID=47763 RepID=UPI000C39F7C9